MLSSHKDWHWVTYHSIEFLLVSVWTLDSWQPWAAYHCHQLIESSTDEAAEPIQIWFSVSYHRGRILTQFDDILLTISPEKRLKVRGRRVFGFISIKTFFSVCMYNCILPALLRGLSKTAINSWWTISGLYDCGFLLCFLIKPTWSSQLSNWKSPFFVFTVSKEARSRITITVLAVAVTFDDDEGVSESESSISNK